MNSPYFFNGAFAWFRMSAKVSSSRGRVRHKSDVNVNVNVKWMVVSTKSAHPRSRRGFGEIIIHSPIFGG